MIYYVFVRSHAIYGIEMCGNTHMKYLNKLMILNNKILHILQHTSVDTLVLQSTQLFILFHYLTYKNLYIILFIIRKNYVAFSLAISPKIICFTPIQYA